MLLNCQTIFNLKVKYVYMIQNYNLKISNKALDLSLMIINAWIKQVKVTEREKTTPSGSSKATYHILPFCLPSTE